MRRSPACHHLYGFAGKLLFLATAITVAAPARAHLFCVATATELQNALTESGAGGIYNGEDNDIVAVGGTYLTNGAPFSFISVALHFIRISGGYEANCFPRTAQTPDTTLDGGGATRVLTIKNANGDVTVNQLVLQNGEGTQPGAGLQVNYGITANGGVIVSDTIIRGNHTTGNAGGLHVASGTSAYIIANLIVENSADGQYAAGVVTGSGDMSVFYSNTVSQNTSTAAATPVGGLFCGGVANCEFHDNIFWNNTTFGLYLGDAGAILSYNDIGTRGGAAPGFTDKNLSVSPKFVDAANGNFRLAGNSPLLNYGTPNGTTYDLDGHRYPTGKVDLGPYQETIFADAFDGN